MKTCIDLSSDLGEGFGPWMIGDGVDEQLMPLISSANVATGYALRGFPRAHITQSRRLMTKP